MRVLVVDDHQDTILMLAKLIEICGYEARMAADGFTALEIARDWRPHFVLLDIGMPKMDGYLLAQRLRNEAGLKGRELVALSGYAKDSARFQESGIDDYLIKPVSLADLKRVLEGQPPSLRRKNGPTGTNSPLKPPPSIW